MKCKCSKLPEAFYLREGHREFEKSLKREDTGNWIWLGSCPKCGALWAVDEWDKYQPQVANRVTSREGWDGLDNIEMRKQLLLKSRGGFTDKKCVWAGCHDKAVKGVMYCLDHLWKTGARR